MDDDVELAAGATSLTLVPGASERFTLALTNRGRKPRAFVLTVDIDRACRTRLLLPNGVALAADGVTPVLAPEASLTLVVEVSTPWRVGVAPAGRASAAVATASVSAAPVGDATHRSAVSVPVQVVPGALKHTVGLQAIDAGALKLDGRDQRMAFELPISVEDRRGPGAGWSVHVAAAPFTASVGARQVALPADALGSLGVTQRTEPGGVPPAGGPAAPAKLTADPTLIRSTRIFSAASESGLGLHQVTARFEVVVPANAYAGRYSGAVLVTVVSGP